MRKRVYIPAANHRQPAGWVSLAIISIFTLLCASKVHAGDLESARHQLEKVRMDVGNTSWSSFDNDVKSTESFLDGLPDADRLPVQKQLDDLKARAAPLVKQYKARGIVDHVQSELDGVADSYKSSPSRSKETLDEMNTLINSDDAKQNVDPDQLKKFQSRIISLQGMGITQTIEMAAPIVKELDDAMAAQPFKDAKSDEEVAHVQRQLDSLKSRINSALSTVPQDDPRVVAIKQKIAGYDQAIAAQVAAAGATRAADNLARQWASQKEYFTGWDDEKDCPTWKQWTQTSSEAIGNMDLTKTIELVIRVGPWLNQDNVKAVARQYPDNTSVKATITEAHLLYDTAALKMNENFNKLVAEAEALPNPSATDRQGLAHIAQRVDYWFNGTAYHDANAARAKALSDKWNSAVAGAATAREATLQKMTEDAAARWPRIAASIKSVDGFTPGKLDEYKGKIIHLKGNNRLGYDYQSGEYSCALTMNGMAVAGKFDPTVRAAVDQACNVIPPDQFPDENWDVYAIVQGPGKIQDRKQVQGDVKVDGEKVGPVSSEQSPTVDCVVVKIFALHAGPVAVGSNGEGGEVVGAPAGVAATGAPAAAESFSFVSLLEHLIELAVCVAAGGLVILKIKPTVAAPVGVPPVTLPGNEQTELAGLAFLAIGILWLLGKLIIGDLLPAASLTLCGLILASNWFAAKNLLPASIASILKSFAIPIAAACIVFGVLHLFMAKMVLF